MSYKNNICMNQMPISDYGPKPFVTNIKQNSMQNSNYRTALWTGCNLQLTLMCIPKGGEVGLEVHTDTDQFIHIESGNGIVFMGDSKDCLNYQRMICDEYAVFVPAGTWHNIVNSGNCSMKIYTIYAPPHHPHGTIENVKP